MAVIYLQHPVHGTKVATSDLEATHDEGFGWKVYDPTAVSAPQISVPAPVPAEVPDQPTEEPAPEIVIDPTPEPENIPEPINTITQGRRRRGG